jgi:acylphosphatase
MAAPTTRIECIFRGHVQGVGFRATARRLAADYPIAGWVRNEADGSVLLVVEGVPEDLRRYLDALRARLGAFIRSSDEHPGAPEGLTGFEIRR